MRRSNVSEYVGIISTQVFYQFILYIKPNHMTTIAVSTIQMAQDYADRSQLPYDHKPYIGGGEFICYDDAGEIIQVIKYCSSNAEIINRVNDKLFENLFALPMSAELVNFRVHG